MKKIIFWIFVFLVAVVSVMWPDFIIMGMFFFLVPGIFLALCPTLFIYGGSISCLKIVLSKCNFRYPFIIAFVIIVGLGCSVSLALNIPIWLKINQIHSQDIALADKIKFPDTVAIFSDEFYSRFQNSEEPICNQLCQKLLYNNVTKRVLVGIDYDQQDVDRKMISYSIEKGQNCPQDGYVSIKDKEDFLIRGAALRMASGECLAKSLVPLNEAGLIFVKSVPDKGKKAIGDPWNLKRDTIRSSRIEFFEKQEDSYTPIYRYTKIEAEPFLMPFTVGPIFGYGLSAKSGFVRYEKGVNATVDYFDYLQDFASPLEGVFGDALKDPVSEFTVSESLLRKIQDPRASSQELSKLFDSFVFQYIALPQKKEISDADYKLLLQCIGDSRIRNFWQIGSMVRISNYDQKNKLIEAAIDRVLIEPLPNGENIVEGILSSLSGSAAFIPTENQRQALNSDPDRKKFIKNYLDEYFHKGWLKEPVKDF